MSVAVIANNNSNGNGRNESQSIQSGEGNPHAAIEPPNSSDLFVSTAENSGVKKEEEDDDVQIIEPDAMMSESESVDVPPFNWRDFVTYNTCGHGHSSEGLQFAMPSSSSALTSTALPMPGSAMGHSMMMTHHRDNRNLMAVAHGSRQMAMAAAGGGATHMHQHQPIASMDPTTITPAMALRATLTMPDPALAIAQMNFPQYVNVEYTVPAPGQEEVYYPCGVCYRLFTNEAEWAAHQLQHPQPRRHCRCNPRPNRPIFKRYRRRRFGPRRRPPPGDN